MADLKTLGWREWVGFPDLNIPRVKAKVDTGARTSALHAFSVEPFRRESEQWVRFSIHPIQGDTNTIIVCESPVFDQRVIRDSGGHEELRYVLQTRMQIGGDLVSSEITLTDRESMKFRMLLGRTALRGRYLVNSGKSYLCGKRPPGVTGG